MTKARFKILLLFFLGLSSNLFSQQAQKNVTGVVLDAGGESIIGASIKNKRTNTGTITDLDGKFSIQAAMQDVVEVSYLGFETQQVNIENNESLKVVLKENNRSLDEVVVIGYGSVKKSNLTTSVSKIGAEAIAERPLTTLSEAFSGQLAGVQTLVASGVPGESLQIVVRGTNSLNSSTPPLYVIDGVITESLNDVNPTDVASIQVLKDAAATAIYGARGSSGVVLIETKQAKQGKPVINFDFYYGTQEADRLPEVMSAKEWLAYNIWQINAAYLQVGGNMDIPNKQRPASRQIPEAWLLNPQADVADWRLNPDFATTDWMDAILQKAATQSYQLSASGSSNLGNIYVSGGYLNQEGIVKYTGYQRINLRINGTLNLNKNMRVGINMAPSMDKQQRGESEGKDKVIMYALQYPPIMAIDKGSRDLGFDPLYPTNINPLERLKQVVDNKEDKRLQASAWYEYSNIVPGLAFKTMYSFSNRTTVYDYFYPGNLVAGTTDRKEVTSGSGQAVTYDSWSIQNTLTYNKTFAEKHHLDILLGQSADESSGYNASYAASNFPSESVYTLNMASMPSRASTSRYTVRTASFFGRLQYDYADKYLFSASVRRDASTRFGPSNRWGIFPSLSGGWKINEEQFMKSLDFITLLKIRASYGLSGNDRIGNFDYLSTYNQVSAVYGNTTVVGMAPANYANPELKWETTRAVDLGFDLSLFKNRFQFNFDYYVNTTKDLLYSKSIPASSGFLTTRTNLASIENRGWEIDFTSTNIDGKDFKWTTSLNLSQSKNKVLDLGDNDNLITQAWNASFLTQVGGPVSQFYLLRSDGLLTKDDFEKDANGNFDPSKPLVPIMTGQYPGDLKYVDVNDDGKITESDDLVAYGDNTPDLLYGITNRFRYKGFELSVFLQGQVGGEVLYLCTRNINYGRRQNNNLRTWLNCYKETYAGGDPIPHELGVDMSWDGKTPSPYGIGAVSQAGKQLPSNGNGVYDATFLKIKNINLSYSFPRSMLSKAGIRQAKIYVSVENLYTFTDYIGNPETNSYNSNNPILRGVDYSTYPLTKKYTLGLNLTF